MQYVVNLWYEMLTFFCMRLKPFVLRHAHPPPSVVEVFAKDSSISICIMTEMIERLNDMTHTEGYLALHDKESVLTVSEGTSQEGLMPGIRFLGRLTRTYPTNPEDALKVDAALERVVDFITASKECESLEEAVAEHIEILEAAFDPDFLWMDGFDSMSVLDVCWAGIFRWVSERDVKMVMPPNLKCWWKQMGPQSDHSSDDSDDEVYQTDSKED